LQIADLESLPEKKLVTNMVWGDCALVIRPLD